MPKGSIDKNADTFEPIPAGTEVVLALLEPPAVATTKSTNRERWSLAMVVEGGEFNGRRVWDGVTFIEPGAPGHGLTRSFLRAWGLISHDQEEYDVSPEDIAGGNARAILRVDTYEGKRNNRVDRWISPNDEPVAATPAKAAPAKTAPAPAKAAPAGAAKRRF